MPPQSKVSKARVFWRAVGLRSVLEDWGNLGSAVSTKNEEKHSQVMRQSRWVKINDFYHSWSYFNNAFHFSPTRSAGDTAAQQTDFCSECFHKCCEVGFLSGSDKLSAMLASLVWNTHTFNDLLKVSRSCGSVNHAGSSPCSFLAREYTFPLLFTISTSTWNWNTVTKLSISLKCRDGSTNANVQM